ncbi:MAG: type II toxin-antitoxin system RelE/ParE family toxin [Nitrospinota bacterium]
MTLVVKRSAQRDLEVLPPKLRLQVSDRIEALAEDPRPRGCRKIGAEIFRIRHRDWRIIYLVDDGNKRVEILAVRHRREAYRDKKGRP